MFLKDIVSLAYMFYVMDKVNRLLGLNRYVADADVFGVRELGIGAIKRIKT